MTDKKSGIANLIYSILLGTLICVIGLFLILFCISIFRSGDKPFTRETVGTYLSRLAITSALCLAAIIFSPFFEMIFTQNAPKTRPERELYGVLRFEKKRLAEKTGETVRFDETKKRTVLQGIRIGLSLISFVPTLVYIFTPTNFSGENVTSEVRAAVIFTFVCALVSGVIYLAISYFERKLAEAELVKVRELIKSGVALEKKVEDKKRVKTLFAVRIAVFVLGLTLLVLGLINGGSSDELGKAINICYECIGLG